MAAPDLVRFRSVIAAACAELELRRREINDLNVFPVPDGDTGDNMVLTLRAVLEELDRLGQKSANGLEREELVAAVARAALLGARGNSGVILSQIVRGAAEELASRPGQLIDPVLLSAAFARASEAAYDSVVHPAEGTILTAMRAMARRVAHEAAHAPRRETEVGEAEQEKVLAWMLERALEAGREAVDHGPEQLAALARARVVDAGAHGLLVILAAVLGALGGARPPAVAPAQAPGSGAGLGEGHEAARFRYCTNFAVMGEGLEPRAFVAALEEIGDSVLVVGGEAVLRVHLHTDAPRRALELFAAVGEVSRLDVSDMREQEAARSTRLDSPPARPRCAAVALAEGSGAVALLEGLGARVLAPDAGERALAAALADQKAEDVVVVAPPHAASAMKRVRPVGGARAIEVVQAPEAAAMLAALVAFDPARSAAENARALRAALAVVRLARVGPLRGDAAEGVGFLGEHEVARGLPDEVLSETIAAVAEGAELLVALRGAGAPLELGALRAMVPEGVELDAHEGGQRDWWWLFCAE